MSDDLAAYTQPAQPRAHKILLLVAVLLFIPALIVIVAGTGVEDAGLYSLALTAIMGTQAVLAILAIIFGAIAKKRTGHGLGSILGGSFALVGAGAGWLFGVVWMFLHEAATYIPSSGGGGGGFWGGGAWGRPLRIKGRQLHPTLTRGEDWTAGPRPDPKGLDEPTRRALEALWLHDAQKEHASVPAFSRVSWLLAAAGGPADLMTWSHRAAIEEIEHTRACFALAAGYGGRSFTVEPMPDLAIGGLDSKADPRITLAIESLSDGCQLEDYNADVAAACALECKEPVTRSVLEMIAREERTHADLSWAILGWLVERHRDIVEPAIRKAAIDLDAYPRPTAVGADKRELVERANPAALLAHGRLPDARWAELWTARLALTRSRLAELLADHARAAA